MKNNLINGAVFIFLMLSMSFCKDDNTQEPKVDPPIQEDTMLKDSVFSVIKIGTKFGDMYAHLNYFTPKHRENFLKLTQEKFFDSTEFHRCVDNFVIQGGDPNSKYPNRVNIGQGGPGYTIEAEIDVSKYIHNYGAIGAARLGNVQNPAKNSSGSQFYIVTNLSGTPHLDREYTVFGQVVKGMNVAKIIEGQPKNASGLPNTPIRMWVVELKLTRAEMQALDIVLPE